MTFHWCNVFKNAQFFVFPWKKGFPISLIFLLAEYSLDADAIEFLESLVKRVARPLSASRRSNKEKQDSLHEAKAVAEAVKAENQRLSDLKRNTHSAPGRHQVSF